MVQREVLDARLLDAGPFGQVGFDLRQANMGLRPI
jgi:hypothetical protein